MAEQYLTFEHDEFTGKPILDENGRLVPRQDYRISSLNCGEEDFAVACMRANLRYGKNQQREDVKSHHYILSFDPRDGPDHGLTMDKAQALGERFCAEQFPGHQALVCTHPDGHNHSGNIHVHIVINSLRVAEVERKPYMDRASDTQAGAKHRCTAAAMRHFRAEVMELCQGAGLYQIDLLGGSKNRVTEREYWAQKKGQLALDTEAAAQGKPPTKFETDKEKLRREIRAVLNLAVSFEDFAQRLLQRGITVKESRGRLSYLTPDRAKPITARKLGDDFDRAAVGAALERNAARPSLGAKPSIREQLRQPQGVQRMVDIEAKKAEGKGIGYQRWASNFNLNDMGDTARLVRGALATTFAFEGVGAAILTACFWPRYGVEAIWKGVFTSISAFCNAGFDIFGTEKIGSLSTYDDHPVVLLTVTALIACGGLGFFVWEEIKHRRRWRRLSLYTKMVITMTVSLLALGALFFLASEYDNPETMGAMPFGQSLLNALFQSTTLRTAGFYSISQGGLSEISLVMCILLMLVGGSSGSCAGGLKTGTVGVLLLTLRSGMRGRAVVTLRGRTIPQEKVLSAVTLVLVVALIFLAASGAITVLDDVSYQDAAYETASAMATVGVTTGITPTLSDASHIILIVLMYLGRVGFVSFSLAFLAQNPARSKISYPETNVMIG